MISGPRDVHKVLMLRLHLLEQCRKQKIHTTGGIKSTDVAEKKIDETKRGRH